MEPISKNAQVFRLIAESLPNLGMRRLQMSLEDLLAVVYESEPMKAATKGEPLPMDRINLVSIEESGFELERLLEGEAQVDRGETVDVGEFFERLQTPAR